VLLELVSPEELEELELVEDVEDELEELPNNFLRKSHK
jgi:hypothetical protein